MKLEKISKALSDKNRLKIIEFLSEGQKNVSSVADKLNVEENKHIIKKFIIGR